MKKKGEGPKSNEKHQGHHIPRGRKAHRLNKTPNRDAVNSHSPRKRLSSSYQKLKGTKEKKQG